MSLEDQRDQSSDTLTAKQREIQAEEEKLAQVQAGIDADKAMAKDFLEEDQEFEGNEKSEAQKIALENLEDQVDDIVTEPIVSDDQQDVETLTEQRIPGAIYQYDKALNQKSGPILKDESLYAPSEVPPNQVQGAPVPQEQLQAVEDTRDQEAQTKLDTLFEDGRRAKSREYHDTQLDPRSAPEVTTAVDKEGIIELLNISDADLKDDAPALAAKTFFKRFRRPVDALAEIGATVAVGPTQNY